ncbi:MAG: pentapeptide repeat-containing protein [Thermodesulfobacteriota bacterium]
MNRFGIGKILLIAAFFAAQSTVQTPDAFAWELVEGSKAPISRGELIKAVKKGKPVIARIIQGDDIIELIKDTDYDIKISDSVIEGGLDFRKLPKVALKEESLPDGWSDEDKAAFVTAKGPYIKKVRIVTNAITINSSEIKSVEGVGSIRAKKTFFNKKIIFKKVVLDGKASFSDALFDDKVRFMSVDFNGGGVFTGALFKKETYFRVAVFGAESYFSGAEFKEKVVFNAIFKERAGFSGATFYGRAAFSDTGFQNDVRFSGVVFKGMALFDEAIFGERAYFAGVEFMGHTDFSDAVFTGVVYFSGTVFKEETHFMRAAFKGFSFFPGARFLDKLSFEKARFSKDPIFSGAVFIGDPPPVLPPSLVR